MLGPQCTDNPPNLSSECGAGTLQEIGALKAYVSTAHHGRSDHAILLISDAHGFKAPNLRKLADKVAAAGYLVVVPDFFYGDQFSPEKPVQEWIDAHSPDKGSEDAKAVIADLKSRGVSKVGAAGFCWGGMVAVRLARSDDFIQAAVLLHPGPITVDQINEVKIPIAILGAETDNYAPPELLKQLEGILASKPEVDSYVKIFPGVRHGWSVRYNEHDESAVRSAIEAQSNMIDWLQKHIK